MWDLFAPVEFGSASSSPLYLISSKPFERASCPKIHGTGGARPTGPHSGSEVTAPDWMRRRPAWSG
eukprot:CAMPEP_0168457822 /NCGR_PEP_ID=MMETSP0228-20121227/52054_1 /TAXON_ID=133427 /ORGANISM="Protoceratium reticulatum, Strain CCCM 535 (=CCMP 1889)" /LENGTH=65 /DNA_ID=CAMNT_0008472891 /DNA_START=73 /DNA_END=266 /DNA_ORIENTATION=+